MVNNFRRSAILVVVIVLACGFLGAVFGQGVGGGTAAEEAETRENLESFAQVYDIVERNYADRINPDKAVYNGAIPGMLHVLDPHSNFFDPKSYAALREGQRGRYYGVGMQVGPRNNKVIVIAPFVGTPAYKAGIRPGDEIVAIDGKSTQNMGTSEVAELLKGPRGTTVHITMLREGVDKPIEFAVVRDEIPRYSVDVHFMIRPGIGYMHIEDFSETTEREVHDALQEFGDLKGLLLDLRGNRGGLLNEGVGVADKFLKKGAVIVSHRGRNSPERVYRASRGNGGKEYTLVVLINRETASASEIVAGAIQDHDRGLIVGETSFGKGLVQTVYPLAENTGLALTTAKYYTPSGRLIQREYNGVSLYDYYYNPEAENNSNKEVKTTDSGRMVYGGGGITPDEKIPATKANHFQKVLLFQQYAFFNFAKRYLLNRHVKNDLVVDDSVMQEFRKFLDQQNIAYTEADLLELNDWLRANIKSELFIAEFGQQEGQRFRLEADPQVLKALDFMPKAKDLAENARRIIAEKAGARSLSTQN